MRIFEKLIGHKSINEELLAERTLPNEEKVQIINNMDDKTRLKYEAAMDYSEVLDSIQNMGIRRWRKLSILEKSIYAVTKEDILFLEKAKQSGRSILEMACSKSIIPNSRNNLKLLKENQR